MNTQDIQRLRALPIETIAQRLGLTITRHKALCPFHDDHHASLTFSQKHNTYRCYACGAHGDLIDLVIHRTGKTFIQACQYLAHNHDIILHEWQYTNHTPTPDKPHTFDPTHYAHHFLHPSLSPQAQQFLYTQRRLHPAVIRWCRLTSWTDHHGIHWLQIPYYDTHHQLIGLQNRNLDYHKDSEAPRFRFPRGAHCTIYNLPILNRLQDAEPLFITEGPSDCWAMLSAGHKAIAIPSATLLTPHDIHTLQTLAHQRHTTFHMYPDQDPPGERLFLQLRQVLPDIQHHQLPPHTKDFAEYYQSKMETIRGESKP